MTRPYKVYIIENKLIGTRRWFPVEYKGFFTDEESAKECMWSLNKTPGYQYKITSFTRGFEVEKPKPKTRFKDVVEASKEIY